MRSFLIAIFLTTSLISIELMAGASSCGTLKSIAPTKIPAMGSSSVCKDRNQWIQNRLSHSKLLSANAVSDEKNLLLLGEAHYSKSCNAYGSVLENFKSHTGVTCLFLEFNNWMFSEIVMTADPDSPVRCFRNLIEQAQSSGIKIFPVDKDGVEKKRDYYLTAKGLNERDEHMAHEIEKRKSDCQRSIMIVGKEHLSAMKPGRHTLADRLKKVYQTEIINLQNTKGLLPPFENQEDLSWTYNGICTPITVQEEGLRIFENDNVPAYMDILPGEGHWRDFNKTIMLQ